jgi:Uma2 family endonuclease
MTTRDRAPRPIFYSERDGKPMGETEIHVLELIRVLEVLRARYADQPNVYVFGNMMFYYEEGNSRASVSPDVCVVFGVPKLPLRRVYKLWDEAPPAAVFEITSRSTRQEDLVKKRALYERIGVEEYYLYDPLAEYLNPPFQGYRLEDGQYRAIESGPDGTFISVSLSLHLRLMDGRLELFDAATGERLLSPSERAQAESERAQVEAEARRAAEARVAELEALLRERGVQ